MARCPVCSGTMVPSAHDKRGRVSRIKCGECGTSCPIPVKIRDEIEKREAK